MSVEGLNNIILKSIKGAQQKHCSKVSRKEEILSENTISDETEKKCKNKIQEIWMK